MNHDPLKAILHPFETGQLSWPEGRVLFLNGLADTALPAGTVIQQNFKPFAAGTVATAPDGPFDMVLVWGGKQHRETQYLIALGLSRLSPDGLLVCVAANDAGGRRLAADIKALGLAPEELSKHKCRVVWAAGEGKDADDWLAAGEIQPILEGAFLSQPGIFGWDKIDGGSALLAQHLPEGKLKGTGADFGCGYGYLARHVMTHNQNVAGLYCLDADYRAVQACRQNLAGQPAHFIWADLTQTQTDLPALDFIVMNPPFHEGKKTDMAIGGGFIKTAAQALKKNADLWMVANRQLPYEDILKKNFAYVETVCEDKGFKIFHARK